MAAQAGAGCGALAPEAALACMAQASSSSPLPPIPHCRRFSTAAASPLPPLLHCRRFPTAAASPLPPLLHCRRFSTAAMRRSTRPSAVSRSSRQDASSLAAQWHAFWPSRSSLAAWCQPLWRRLLAAQSPLPHLFGLRSQVPHLPDHQHLVTVDPETNPSSGHHRP